MRECKVEITLASSWGGREISMVMQLEAQTVPAATYVYISF